jgi:hypothetical protein
VYPRHGGVVRAREVPCTEARERNNYVTVVWREPLLVINPSWCAAGRTRCSGISSRSSRGQPGLQIAVVRARLPEPYRHSRSAS